MTTDGAATWTCPAEHMWSRKWGGTEISAMLQTGSRQEPLPEPATLRKSGTLCFCPPGHALGGFPKRRLMLHCLWTWRLCLGGTEVAVAHSEAEQEWHHLGVTTLKIVFYTNSIRGMETEN